MTSCDKHWILWKLTLSTPGYTAYLSYAGSAASVAKGKFVGFVDARLGSQCFPPRAILYSRAYTAELKKKQL